MAEQLELFGDSAAPSPSALGSPLHKVLMPENGSVFDVPMTLDGVMKSGYGLNAYVDNICKALTAPPGIYNFGQLQTLPDPNAEGIIAWPGLPPETLRKMSTTLLAPKIVINQRVNDVLSYSQLSPHPWKKGWAIEMVDAAASPTESTLRSIKEAEQFICNCNSEYPSTKARLRDAQRYYSFPQFLALITRDSYTYDGIAVYTDMDLRDKVKGFTPLPAGNIRLAGTGGYLANPEKFAVLVDESGTIYRSFTRDELIWMVRNPSTDSTTNGYGMSELAMAAKLVDAFENAMELNMDIFSKSGIPQGMLRLKGLGWTNRELDMITRTWANLKKGVSKFWTLPAMVLPPDTDIDFLDLSAAAGKEGLFQDYINMLMGTYTAICNFPIRRLGFRISGKTAEPTIKDGPDTSVSLYHEEDSGLVVFLQLIENFINQYILWTRWPHLRFVFRGKTPREDAREYEIRQLSQTYGERRAMTDNPPLEKLAADDDMKIVAKLMDLAPTDAALTGVFQSLASAFITAKLGTKENSLATPGAPFPHKKDPASAEEHGAISGVRRQGNKETN